MCDVWNIHNPAECFSLVWPVFNSWRVRRHIIKRGFSRTFGYFHVRPEPSWWSVSACAHESCPGQGPVSHLANLSIEPVPGLWIERKRKGSWSAQTSRASLQSLSSLSPRSDLTLWGPTRALTLSGAPVVTAIWANLRLSPGFNQSRIEAIARVNDKTVDFSSLALRYFGLLSGGCVTTAGAGDWLSSRCTRVSYYETCRETPT